VGKSRRDSFKIHYDTGVVFIRFAGTHKEYGAIDANTL
jgi:mRNA-degrading endonuclease HigB of HigAB toxin-antitoxin module